MPSQYKNIIQWNLNGLHKNIDEIKLIIKLHQAITVILSAFSLGSKEPGFHTDCLPISSCSYSRAPADSREGGVLLVTVLSHDGSDAAYSSSRYLAITICRQMTNLKYEEHPPYINNFQYTKIKSQRIPESQWRRVHLH